MGPVLLMSSLARRSLLG